MRTLLPNRVDELEVHKAEQVLAEQIALSDPGFLAELVDTLFKGSVLY